VIAYGYAWLHDLIRQTAGLELDEAQMERIAAVARRKLVDLFDVAEETALANGREVIRRHDLPLTKGMRRTILETATHARAIEIDPAFFFSDEARVDHSIDELVRADLPRLTAALLVLASRVIAALEPTAQSPEERDRLESRRIPDQPAPWELERAERVLDLTI
jgi:hypothetical protein